MQRLRLLRQFLANPTERLRGNTEVGGNLTLGNALDECGVRFDEIQVPLFRRGAECLFYPVVSYNVVRFLQEAEVSLKFWNSLQHLVPGWFLEEQYLRILQRIYVVDRGLAAQEALEVGDPPVLNGKLDNVFFSVAVDSV